MTTTASMVWLIIGCALVTWLPRIIPFMFVRSVKLPDVVLKWLSFIPVCILSALVIENLLDTESKNFVTLDWYLSLLHLCLPLSLHLSQKAYQLQL